MYSKNLKLTILVFITLSLSVNAKLE